jgi:hypothetical protein
MVNHSPSAASETRWQAVNQRQSAAIVAQVETDVKPDTACTFAHSDV